MVTKEEELRIAKTKTSSIENEPGWWTWAIHSQLIELEGFSPCGQKINWIHIEVDEIHVFMCHRCQNLIHGLMNMGKGQKVEI